MRQLKRRYGYTLLRAMLMDLIDNMFAEPNLSALDLRMQVRQFGLAFENFRECGNLFTGKS